MNQQIETHWIFFASPSDLAKERETFRKLVERSNRTCAQRNLRFQLLPWEDKSPAFGRPQDLINPDVDRADLFVGCLWRTLGSPSGDGSTTGFEEEFSRALARREETGKPEIALFSKVRGRELTNDHDNELRKVLDFWEKYKKRLLFKEFESPAEWEQNVNDLLWGTSLKLAASRVEANNVQSASFGQSQAESTDRNEEPAASPAALASLARLLRTTGNRLAGAGKFEIAKITDAAGCARLMLFSATNYDWNVEHIRLGTHEANSVYVHRKTLTPTAHERLFLLRTVLLDPFSRSPGWLWIPRRRWRSLVTFLAVDDSDPVMRETAVRFAAGAGIPFHRGKKTPKAITRILQDNAASVRVAGLHFLAVNGMAQDLNHVTPLLLDQTSDVRYQANRAAWRIRMRSDADSEMRKTIARGDAFDDEMRSIFDNHVQTMNSETLTTVSKSSVAQLRPRAAKELLLRGAVPPELARSFCQDASKRLKEYGYVALAQMGERVDLAAAREDVKYTSFDLLPEWGKPNFNHVVAAVFAEMPTHELWEHVEAFNADSRIAISELSRRLPAVEFRSAILNDLEDRFERFAIRTKDAQQDDSSWLSWPSKPEQMERTRINMVGATLEALAEKPLIDDRMIFSRFLPSEGSEYRSQLACLRGLGAVGTNDDREKIARHLSSSLDDIEAAAARAYIQTFPDILTAAPDLCSTRQSAVKLWVLVSTALYTGAKNIWPLLKPFLTNHNDDMRRIACLYATHMLSSRQLATLLDEYLNESHYYDVVVFLDRTLYSPSQVRKYFEDREREYFQKWVSLYHPKTGVRIIGEPWKLARETPPDAFP